MNFFYRFQMIFESTIGSIIVAILAVLALLVVVYLILRLRQRSQDALAYLFQEHYEKVKAVTPNLTYVGVHTADIFGRRTIVQAEDENYAFCLAPPQDIVDASTIEKFSRYYAAIKHQNLPIFTRYTWVHEKDPIVVVQNKVIRSDGRPMTCLSEYMLDNQFGVADAELILLELARGLASLHELSTDKGELLYYGFLIPRSLFLGFDASKRIDSVVLADHGFPFFLGPDKMAHRFEMLNEKTRLVDALNSEKIRSQLPMLAPEQRNRRRVHEVGPASDFYAFAALALLLFDHKPFTHVNNCDWSKVPPKWVPFLKGCLDDDPTRRPTDFLELQDRLCDPDLALTHHESMGEIEAKIEDEPENIMTLDALAVMLQNSDSFEAQDKEVKGKASFAELIKKGNRSLNTRKWATAKKYFKKAYKINNKNSDVNVGLAVIYYEEGNFDKAEKFYEVAKAADSRVAKRFREHIAFRV